MSLASRVPSSQSEDSAQRRLVRRAWWSLAGLPVSFALAMVVGEGIASLAGREQPGLGDLPWWLVIAAFGAAVLIFAAPLLLTSRWCRAAREAGASDARVPLIVGGTTVAGFVLLNLISGLLQLLT